jgi:hypothetical protein
MSSLKSRLGRIETVTRPMIQERERRINNYIAECGKRGLKTTREAAEEADAFMGSEMARLHHLPMQERLKQASVNFSIHWYRKKTGASEEEAREALRPLMPELCTA